MSKEKLLASAQKNLEKGQIAKAIKDFRKVVDADPRDVRNRQKLAELYSRARQNDEALTEYAAVAKVYGDNGFFLKAIAVYKQMQRLDPSRPELYLRLAELNQKQGLIGNAAAEYRNLSDFYEAKKMFPEAVGVLEKLKELEPDNPAIRIRIIETFLRGGLQDRAKKEFSELIELLRAKGDLSRALRLYDLFLPLNPNDPELRAGYAEALIRHGDLVKGVEMLVRLVETEPENPLLLDLLAEGYRRQGDFPRERDVLQRGLALHPENLEWREAFIRSLLGARDFKQALERLEPWRESFLQGGKGEVLLTFGRLLETALPADPRVARLLAGTSSDELCDPTGGVQEGVGAETPPGPMEETFVIESTAHSATGSKDREMGREEDFEAEELTLADLSFVAAEEPGLETSAGERISPPSPTGREEEARASFSPDALEIEVELELDLDHVLVEVSEDEWEEELEELEDEFVEELSAPPLSLPAPSPDEIEPESMVLELTEESVEKMDPGPAVPVLSPPSFFAPGSPSAPSEFVNLQEDLLAALEDPSLTPDEGPTSASAPAPKGGIRTGAVQLEDAESHFQLGIAYKEMGLLEEAVTEFEKAINDPARGAACLMLKGICLGALGKREQAEAAFKSGLAHPRLADDEKLSLHYELGSLYDEWGRLLEALDSFQYVADLDLFFRQAGDRIAELRRRLGLDEGRADSPGAKGNRKRVSYI